MEGPVKRKTTNDATSVHESLMKGSSCNLCNGAVCGTLAEGRPGNHDPVVSSQRCRGPADLPGVSPTDFLREISSSNLCSSSPSGSVPH